MNTYLLRRIHVTEVPGKFSSVRPHTVFWLEVIQRSPLKHNLIGFGVNLLNMTVDDPLALTRATNTAQISFLRRTHNHKNSIVIR